MSEPFKRIETNPAEAFDRSRLWGRESYTLSNMLVRQEGYPRFAYVGEESGATGDYLNSAWSDREPDAWSEAVKAADPEESCRGGGAEEFFRRLSREAFLEFFRAFLRAAGAAPRVEITGGRIVRFTNHASGYPCYRADFFGKHRETPECREGARVTHPPAVAGYLDDWARSVARRENR